MRASGLAEGLVQQIQYLYTDLTRYVRIAGAYGATIQQTNGVGQGCSISIIVANLYVATLFRALKHRHLEVELGAFLDDKNITAQSLDQLVAILEFTASFDEYAGHKTNLTKSLIFANTPSMRKAMKHVSVQ